MTEQQHQKHSDQDQRAGSEHDSDPWRSARDMLGRGAEKGWVFGVCATLARRTGWELWAVRAVSIVLLLMLWWVPVALVYLGAAMLMDETRPATQSKLKRWARRADDLLEVLWNGLRRLFNSNRRTESFDDETYSRY